MRTVLATLHSKYVHASLALPCLAAFCGPECGEILLREFTVHEPRQRILAELLAADPQVVALSVYLWNRRESLELADALAAARPGLRVVLGGPEVSFDGPALLEAHPGVTALVRGEGELPLRELLRAWAAGTEPAAAPRTLLRAADGTVEGPDGPPLENLDRLPSPFAAGRVDLARGLVYYESSRGCPYRCAFCLSARDDRVRSFSGARIRSDLQWLMEREVPLVKLVDRTFNYDPARAREIWAFILERSRATRFHFEIGAHLLQPACLELLERVPEGMFQFEIGVQSTLPATLERISRTAPLERLEAAVRRLREAGRIHLHLDLIAGLPGEGYAGFLASLDRVAALRPHHLQVEPVKLIPGSPLRGDAAALGLRHDPHPPYTVLGTPELAFAELVRLEGIGRLLDLTYNSGRGGFFLEGLAAQAGSLSAGLAEVEAFFRERDLFRHPLSQRGLFEEIWKFVLETRAGEAREGLRERLARDLAACERLVPAKVPGWLEPGLVPEEEIAARERARELGAELRGRGVKVQHFAAAFSRLPGTEGRRVLLFLYLSGPGRGLETRVETLAERP